MKRFWLSMVMVSCCLVLRAQEFNQYDITDGLSSIEVTDIEENENFLWIATSDGLNRFDGENFKVFKRENGSTNCLSENNIEALFFDSEGFLWIGLKTGGADIYDPRKDRFVHISEVIDIHLPIRVISILEDSQKNIWLGTWEEGLYKLIPRPGDNRSFNAEIHYPGYIVSSLAEKPEGFIRVGTYYGFFVYDLNHKKWIDNESGNISITQFLDTGDKNSFWCSTWNSGLIKLTWDPINPGTMSFAQQYRGESFNSIYRIIGGNDRSVYLGTWGNGLKKFSPDKNTVENISSKSFTASLINCLFRDRYNNIWVGTYGGGIFRFNPEKTGLKHFPEADKLSAPAISLASFKDHRILLGTQGLGMYLLDLHQRTLAPNLNTSARGDFKNYILSLYADPDYIFVGHDGSGIQYMIRQHQSNREFFLQEFRKYEQIEKVTAFFPAEDGTIWIGTKQSGLISFRMNPETQQPDHYIHYDKFGRDEITGFALCDDHSLFISSHNGLFRFNKVAGQVEKDGRLISNELVYKILGDPLNNCLWIGTSTNLMRLDYHDLSRAFPAFPNDLLPQGAIRALSLDGENNLWFSVGGRLFCHQNKDKRVREINPELLGNHAILSSTSTRMEGREHLVFGTTDNLILIEPHLLLNQPELSKVLFTELQIDHKKINVGEKVFGNVILNEATEYVRTIRLSYKCRWISLSFAETGWDLYKNKFQYRIKGFSDTWQYLDLSNPITFSYFNPGEYRIEIRKYEAGQDAPLIWSMDINITPPWWKTVWFYILLLLVIILTASAVAIMIINYYKKRHLIKLEAIQKQKEEELLKEKESFFTGLSHDLLTPFSLILAPVNDLIRESSLDDPKREKLEIIRKNTSFLSDMFTTILDFKRAELSDTQLKETHVEIVSFARIVLNAFDYLARSRKITLSFYTGIESMNISTDTVKVERILYNLLSNAIKNTPDGGTVSLALDPVSTGNLSITITDNGYGIDEKSQQLIFEKFYKGPVKEKTGIKQGLGLGLYIVKKFVNMLNGSIEVTSLPDKGTQIRVNFPIKIIGSGEKAAFEAETIEMEEGTSTILIAEDNEEMLEYMRKKLTARFNIITAVNGKEAIKLIEKYMPEIIITDVMMPEMDGLALCSAIKENRRYDDLFVVVLTAMTSTEDELQGYKKGADIYIKKPFDSEVLLNQMVNIHNTRQRRKSLLLSSLISKENGEIEFGLKETFLQRSMQVIEEHIMHTDFTIDAFAAEMNMSKTVLHRKFKLMIGQTPNQFIRLVRLRKSVNLLRNSDHTIAEIAYLAGFNQSHYFIKCFRELYHETPKNFRDHENNIQ